MIGMEPNLPFRMVGMNGANRVDFEGTGPGKYIPAGNKATSPIL